MPKLRLFANLREIAGASRIDIPSDTVGGVIEAASQRFGDEFRAGVKASRVWVNGVSAGSDDALNADDEVVLLPPVSGGGQPVPSLAVADLFGFASVFVAILAVVANLMGQEFWASMLVAVAALWAVDVGTAFRARGRMFAPLAVVVSSAGGVMAAHAVGGSGYGLTIAIAVVVGLGWAVVVPEYRDPAVFAPVFITSLMAGLASASLTLSRSAFSPDDSATDVFLVAVIAGVLLGAIAERLPALPLVDPFSVTAIGAVLAAVGAAALWDLDVVGYLLIGLGISVALVAGRGFASMLRTGTVALTERPPGVLAPIDGIIVAGAIYYPLLLLIL